MQQPPPIHRKIKHVSALKAVQIEQLGKLQTKQQVESDLLEDLRNYTKLRSNIEREYAQATQKLVSQYLQKFPPRELDKEELCTPFAIWRQILTHTEELAKRRLEVSHILSNDIAEPIKSFKANRQLTLKKATQLSERLHEEIVFTITDLDKTQKAYNEHQKVAMQAREHANEAEEKLRKGTVRFYQSKGKLEKTLNKTQSKKEVGEKLAAVSRNEYILSLAASNAHQQRYYGRDLPELIEIQDSNIYDTFKCHFLTVANLEINSSEKTAQSFKALSQDASALQRVHALEAFLKKNPVFTQCLSYDFKAFGSDQVTTLSQEFNADLDLNKEARKWAGRVAKEKRFINRKTNELLALNDSPPVANGNGIIKDKDSLNEEIRHLEVLKCKADARLDAMRQSGINVDEWLHDAIQLQEEEERKYLENNNDGEATDKNEFDDEWDEEEDNETPYNTAKRHSSDDAMSTTSSQGQIPCSARAIYSFFAASCEELSINDGEDLEILERDGEGWCKGRNITGQVGFFPESYVEVKSSPPMPRDTSLSNIHENVTVTIEKTMNMKSESISDHIPGPSVLCQVRALYDYTPLSDEELAFNEGDVINVTNKDENGVDDGWWVGTLDDRTGVFPSLVVEEIS